MTLVDNVAPGDIVVRQFSGRYLIWRVREKKHLVWGRAMKGSARLTTRTRQSPEPVNSPATPTVSGSATRTKDTERFAALSTKPDA